FILISSSYIHFLYSHPVPLDLPSFPTRRSSDLLSGSSSAHAINVRTWTATANRLLVDIRNQEPRKIGDSSVTNIVTVVRFVKTRSEEHTSELQSRFDLVCRLLLEKKKKPQCSCT